MVWTVPIPPVPRYAGHRRPGDPDREDRNKAANGKEPNQVSASFLVSIGEHCASDHGKHGTCSETLRKDEPAQESEAQGGQGAVHRAGGD